MDLSSTLNDTTLQHDLFGLFPSAADGRATRDRYGYVYLRDLGQRGGTTTRDRYGLDYLRELARRGGFAKRVKEDTIPRTVEHWDDTQRRLVPYRPPLSRRRRPTSSSSSSTSPDFLTVRACTAIVSRPVKPLRKPPVGGS
jgi:hypothetical protein